MERTRADVCVVIEDCCTSNLLQRVSDRELKPAVVIEDVVMQSQPLDVVTKHALGVRPTRAVRIRDDVVSYDDIWVPDVARHTCVDRRWRVSGAKSVLHTSCTRP